MKKLFFFPIIVFLLATINGRAQMAEITFSSSSKTAQAASEFKSGDYIYAHLKFNQPLGNLLTLNDRPVTFVTEFYLKGKLVEEEMYGFDVAKVKGTKQASIVLPVISDPAVDVPAFGKNLFAFRLPAALASLPADEHEIEFVAKSYNFKDAAEPMAKGTFKLVVGAGASAWFKKNEKDSYDAMTKRGVSTVIASERDVAMGVIGGTSVITLVNNCGRSVWMRKAGSSDKREYRLASGQEMKYDRDGGYLEEWNFGTGKWTTVTKVFEPNAAGKANICK